jgi:hypothetical protein
VSRARINDRQIERIARRVSALGRLTDNDLDRIATRLEPDPTGPRRRVRIAAALLVISTVLAAGADLVVPPIRASVATPGENGIDHIVVSPTIHDAVVAAHGRSTRISVGSRDDTPSKGRTLLFGFPVSGTHCAALAKSIGGACGDPSTARITHVEPELSSTDLLGVAVSGQLSGRLDLQGSGPKELSVSPDAQAIRMQIRCHAPGQTATLTLGIRRLDLSSACAEFRPATLWLRIFSNGGPLSIQLDNPHAVGIDVPSGSATTAVTDATATAGTDDAIIDEPRPVDVKMTSHDRRRGFRLVTGMDQRLSVLSTPSATGLSAPTIGQRVHPLLWRWRDAALLISGAILALVCTLLTDAYLERTR